jgi:hypothetical protein
MQSSTTRKKIEFDDLIELIDTNGSSPTTAEDLESASHDYNICSKTSHVSE